MDNYFEIGWCRYPWMGTIHACDVIVGFLSSQNFLDVVRPWTTTLDEWTVILSLLKGFRRARDLIIKRRGRTKNSYGSTLICRSCSK